MTQAPAIIIQTYDLLKFVIGILKHFPRDQKYLLADRIHQHIADLLELFIEAYFSPKGMKKKSLLKANIKLEQLRYYIRLCYELGFYNSNKYQIISAKLQEIGSMNGGWIKSLP